MRRLAATLAVALMFVGLPIARADIVRFKSGVEAEGVVTRLRDRITIENEDGMATVAASQVEDVIRTPVSEGEPDATRMQAAETITTEPPLGEARDAAGAEADEDVVSVTAGRPRIDTISTGTHIDVRPIVGPRRRYVFLELRGRRTHAPIWRTYTFQTGPTRIRLRR